MRQNTFKYIRYKNDCLCLCLSSSNYLLFESAHPQKSHSEHEANLFYFKSKCSKILFQIKEKHEMNEKMRKRQQSNREKIPIPLSVSTAFSIGAVLHELANESEIF